MQQSKIWYRANPCLPKTLPTGFPRAVRRRALRSPTHLDAVQSHHPHVQEDPVQHRHWDVLQNSSERLQRAVICAHRALFPLRTACVFGHDICSLPRAQFDVFLLM